MFKSQCIAQDVHGLKVSARLISFPEFNEGEKSSHWIMHVESMPTKTQNVWSFLHSWESQSSGRMDQGMFMIRTTKSNSLRQAWTHTNVMGQTSHRAPCHTKTDPEKRWADIVIFSELKSAEYCYIT